MNKRRESFIALAMMFFLLGIFGTELWGAEKCVFLVHVSEKPSWQEYAVLAAVPASAMINEGAPAVIALDGGSSIPEEIRHYLELYGPGAVYLLGEELQAPAPAGGSLDFPSAERAKAASASEAACILARRFWREADRAVLCGTEDYGLALAASALAGRLRMPLLYTDGEGGLPDKTLDALEGLGVRSLFHVGGRIPAGLWATGLPIDALVSAEDVIRWMEAHGLPVEYFAAANPLDPGSGRMPRSSLAAPLLAVGRRGNVALLAYDTLLKMPFPATNGGPMPSIERPRDIDISITGPADPDRSVSWITLFDGKQLGSWKLSEFGGDGEVAVRDGAIRMGMGNNLTGITWRGDPPARMDYEIALEARRTEGTDFFCGLTFPVESDPCTLIMGGWGGGLTGLSSLDGFDASENDSSRWINYENGRWYRIRLRVTRDHISAWLDDERVVYCKISGRRISIRSEVDLSKPLGIACWQTAAEIRNIRLRRLEE